MEFEELDKKVFFRIFINEKCYFINEEYKPNIKKKAQEKIIEIAKNMGIMRLGYYDITRKNKWLFSEITSKINAEIQNYLDSFNVLSVQKVCVHVANVLSACSFAIFEPDLLSKDSKKLVDDINFLSQITGEKPDGIEVQEKIALLKEALNLIYFETQCKAESIKTQNEVTEEDFINLLDLEVAAILIFELSNALKLNKNCVIHLQDTSLCIYSEQLENIDKLLKESLTVKEPLYDKIADDVMSLFKKEKGFDEKSLILLCDDFEGEETIFRNLSDMKSLIKERLRLNSKQFDFFIEIMFLKCKAKCGAEIIKNVNYSFFTTPFVLDKNGLVWLNKSNLMEAAKYLRRRVINEDIPLPKNIKNIIREKINEKLLPIIKEELQAIGIECFINVNLEKDEKLKGLLDGIKNTPHELDLYYVDNNVLKIYDLKNYLIPLSIKDSVVRIGNSIKKEKIKLRNLNRILEHNHKLIEERLNIHFDSIEYGILLTTDCYHSDKHEDISVIFVDDFFKMIRSKSRISSDSYE